MVDLRGWWLNELVEMVSSGGGVLPCSVRRDLVSGKGIAGDLGELAVLVAAGGLGVTDEHIRRLLASGYSEDAVFECVVVAGVERLRAVGRLLHDRRP